MTLWRPNSSATDYSWLRNLRMTFLPNAVQHPAARSPIEGLCGHVYKELSLWQNRAYRPPPAPVLFFLRHTYCFLSCSLNSYVGSDLPEFPWATPRLCCELQRE